MKINIKIYYTVIICQGCQPHPEKVRKFEKYIVVDDKQICLILNRVFRETFIDIYTAEQTRNLFHMGLIG